jgi:outer membrane lipoprotein-sorting protein
MDVSGMKDVGQIRVEERTMFHRLVVFWFMLTAVTSFAAATEKTETAGKLSATEIAERNVTARGGLQKWRSVQTLTMTGKMEAGGNNRSTLPMPGRKDSRFVPPPRPAEQVRLPFVMELKRPRKMRVEVQFNGQTAIQVFDGTNGWKLRPFLNRKEIEPYTEEEMKTVATQAELDGPLIDYAAKGTTFRLIGTEKVEGHDTYRLRLTMKSGKTTDLWIDATTFLEAKIEGTPRRLDGKYRSVEVYYRDYRTVDGLQIPFVLETKVLSPQTTGLALPTTASEQILLEKVEVNPQLNDAAFSRADLETAASGKSTATMAR